MNDISLVKRYKKELVVQKEKCNRYRIYNYRKYYPRQKERSDSGKALFCYDYGDSLVLARISYCFNKRADKTQKPDFFNNKNIIKYKIKFKNGRVNVWSKYGENKIVNYSNNICKVDNDIFSSLKKIHPIYKRRLNSIIINFLRRHNIKFKYSKDYQQNLLWACYPGVTRLEIAPYLGSLYSRYFRRGDIKYVVKKSFGADNKKLVKMICKRIEKDKNCEILNLGFVLKGLIPLDYFYKLIDINISEIKGIRERGWCVLKLKEIRNLIKNYNSQRLLKLFLAEDFNSYNFRDSVRLYANNNGNGLPPRPQNWTEIHDHISPPRPIRYCWDITEELDLPVRKGYDEIDGKEIEGFKFEVPKHSKDLVNYSNEMNNCIRGYSSQILNNNCNILGIYKDNQLVYNISVFGKKLDQFKAKYNEEPPEEDKKKILDILVKKNLVFETKQIDVDTLNYLF